MSARLGKRPPEPRSRGTSPPNKRSRLPESRPARQDNAHPLRKSLTPSTHDTGPVPAQNIRLMSPTSIGSGRSTPTHQSAPPAPSTRPVESSQHATESTRDGPRTSMQSLRHLRDRRRAIANKAQSNPSEKPAATTTLLDSKLKAQQLDICQLKKERDELSDRLKKMEDCYERLNRRGNEPKQDFSEYLQPILSRLNALEKSSLELQEKSRLNPVQDRLSAIEAALLDMLQDIDRIGQSQSTTGSEALVKMSALENDIAVLNKWRLSQPKAITEDMIRKFATEEIGKTEDVRAVIRREITEAEERLDQRIATLQQPLHDAWDGPKDMESATATIREEDLRTVAGLRALEDQIKDIQTNLGALSDDLNETDQKVHEHSTVIGVIQNQVPELFRQQFVPFKSAAEERLQTINNKLDTHADEIAILRWHTKQLQAKSQPDSLGHKGQSQLDSLAADAATLKANMAALQSETAAKIHAISEKAADAQTMEKQVDSIMFALRDLEHRYQNISTDEIHQKMVHWFTQTYPTSEALVKDTAQIQRDITALKKFCNRISWVPSRTESLNELCQHAKQLKTLAISALDLQQLAQISTKLQLVVQSSSQEIQVQVQCALLNAKMAMTKAQDISGKLDENYRVLHALQNTVSENLNLHQSSFAKADALIALQNRTKDLESHIREIQAERLAGVQELRTILSTHHEKRVEIEQRIKNDIHELKALRSSLVPQVSRIAEQVDDVQVAAYEHRQDFDSIKNTLIEPNRDFFGLFGTILTVLAQLQQAVEGMNQNLSVAPLKLDWQYYLPALVEPPGENAGSCSGNGADKDKQ
ncbi:hypothetical protein ACJQWK_01386 [Exserohilum turcicum]|uniref:Uncharacterized protein n=1 Tax=Exserohilum turcicum (strain 28A) TaxID=671987 RepID=R0IMQ2_EXST2|nr:uncharacterized protein SETTUDRAFT_184829 [Exserohilum turcica Et28A]EOA86061.1 hypothetical protein SETTUDRAFT_184829 [Exserohilum turcica Et28A]